MDQQGYVLPLDAKIRDLYENQGISMDRIAEQVGISRADVKRRLQDLGIRIRGKGEMLRGRKRPPEVGAKISAALKGHKQPEARRKAHSERMKGKLAGPRNPNWKGGIKHDDAGYRLVSMPNHPRANNMGYVREHILVMEEILDRPIEPDEEINHMNGVKDDNSPMNLMLFKNGRDHRKWHAYMRRYQRQQAGD